MAARVPFEPLENLPRQCLRDAAIAADQNMTSTQRWLSAQCLRDNLIHADAYDGDQLVDRELLGQNVDKANKFIIEIGRERAQANPNAPPPATDLGDLSQQLQAFKVDIDKNFEKLDKKLNKLQTEMTSVKKDVATIKKDVANVKKDVANVKKDVANVNNNVEANQLLIKRLENQICVRDAAAAGDENESLTRRWLSGQVVEHELVQAARIVDGPRPFNSEHLGQIVDKADDFVAQIGFERARAINPDAPPASDFAGLSRQLQAFERTVTADLTTLKTDLTTLKTDLATLKTDLATVKADGLKTQRLTARVGNQTANFVKAQLGEGGFAPVCNADGEPVPERIPALDSHATINALEAHDLVAWARYYDNTVAAWNGRFMSQAQAQQHKELIWDNVQGSEWRLHRQLGA
ncbi:hypothetical protein ACM66B_003218 [Microbotryomycetes sp. NB124-2]